MPTDKRADVGASRYNFEFILARKLQARFDKLLGDSAATKLGWHKGVGENHRRITSIVVADGELVPDPHFESMISSVVRYGKWRFSAHRLVFCPVRPTLRQDPTDHKLQRMIDHD